MRSASQLKRDSLLLLSRRLNRTLVPPDRVSVNVTLRCNLKCTMCTTCYDAPELSTEELKGIIDQTAAWGVEVFNPLGGEPFMRADIEELLAYAVRRGFYVTTTTNGTLITEKRARGIAAIPSDRLHFNVSLDGDEESHDRIRSRGMWKRAIQGYSRIRAADAAAGNSRRKILSNTILHAGNLDRFEAVLDEQVELGFDGVQILNLFRAGPEAPPEAAGLWFRDRHMPALETLSERLAQRAEAQGAGSAWRIQNTPEELRQIPRYYREELGPLEAPCWAGWKELYINADGQAIMCDGELDFLAGAFGNVREQTLRQLWQSPALRERREVVKQCATPCIQQCYLRPESDSAGELARDGARLLAQGARQRLARVLPGVEEIPGSVLSLELSDVCPCDWEGCPTPHSRWRSLVAGVPEVPSAATWASLRDRGHLDFGRGFMGFEVVRGVVADLQAARLRFEALSLSWRGDPLLHPECEPILRFLLGALSAGTVARSLRIETSGRFLTEGLADLVAQSGVPVTWILDLDKGDGAGVDLLLERGRPGQRLLLAARVVPGLDADALRGRFPGLPVALGPEPEAALALWLRRTDHDHFLANQVAREALLAAGEALGLPVEAGREDRPRRCRALALGPVVSWDGKITTCTWDTRLDNRVGEVTSGALSGWWRSAERAADLARCGATGVPDRALCRDCPFPWSPNHPGAAQSP